jgi:8-oxo-dGTP diphosphatase
MNTEILSNKGTASKDAAGGQKDIKTILKELESEGIIGISVDCVIFGFDDNELKVLLIKSDFQQYENKWSTIN